MRRRVYLSHETAGVDTAGKPVAVIVIRDVDSRREITRSRSGRKAAKVLAWQLGFQVCAANRPKHVRLYAGVDE